MKTRSRVFRAAQLPPELGSRWAQLLLASTSCTAFLSPEYCATADRIFGNTFVCVIEESGEPQAFFPFSKPTHLANWTGAGRPVSGALADYVGLICKDGFCMDPPRLMSHAGIHSFLFTHLDASQLRFGLMGDAPRTGLAASFPEGFKKYCSETRQSGSATPVRPARLRKLARDHGEMVFKFSDTYDADKLDQLIRLKSDQYQRTGVSNPIAAKASQRFLHALARLTPSVSCTPVFSTLHAGDRLIAAHFGLQCGQTLHYWFPVHDPMFNAFSPGRILLWNMIRHAAEIGIGEMDFGEGDTPSKRRFANREHTYYRGFYVRNTPQGLADRTAMALRWRFD